jgi:nucleoside phosphorylase
MPILKNKALELIDEKIEQFQQILDTATYDTRYNPEYYEVYHGTEGLVAELFSEEEKKKFRKNVSNYIFFATTHIDYGEELKKYKKHINKCISQLKVYKERIKNFWEEPKSIENESNNTINPEARKTADILLVTATKTESKAVLDVFKKATGEEPHLVSIGNQIYHDIGSVNEKSIVLVQSEMGSGGPGASLLTVHKAITDLSPNEVIMVGIAFGIDPEKQSIGDVLVSNQLMLYELQRAGTKDENLQIIPRGDRPSASTQLVSCFKGVNLYRNKPKYNVHFGLILSGEKLVDNVDLRQQLLDLEPEAIGGEMEGSGLYAACHDSRVNWIIVKAICDWADGKKSENKEVKQKLAAKNAANFVLYALQLVSFTGK